MALPGFDPHPLGCPVGLRVTPSDMPDTITSVILKLRDLMHGSIFEVNPSKGQTYPILYLYADDGDDVPRVVLFPGWEDDRRNTKRRVTYARQCTLLERIAAAGVSGESLESYRGLPSDRHGPGPLMLPLAVAAGEMDTVVHDLFERLGDHVRITVTKVAQDRNRPDLLVVRVYSLMEEKRPRLILFPGWKGEQEGGVELLQADMEEIMARVVEQRLQEIPVEALFQ